MKITNNKYNINLNQF